MDSYKEHIWQALQELDTNALIFVDTEGVIRDINNGVTEILGYSIEDLIGRDIEILIPPAVKQAHKDLYAKYVKLRNNGEISQSKIIGAQRFFPENVNFPNHGQIRMAAIHKNQQELPISLTINEVRGEADLLIGFFAIIQNNSQQHQLQQTLSHQSSHDSLTGLMNWHEYDVKISALKNRRLAAGEEYQAAILYLDVDYFKTVNYFSRSCGDQAIKKIATWLLNSTRHGNNRDADAMINRFLADEFILYLPDTSLAGALSLARRLKTDFQTLNLRTTAQPYLTSLCIGIAPVTESTILHEAVTQASGACSVAKSKGRNKIVVAKAEDTSHLQLEPTIYNALSNKRLMLYAQKIVPLLPGNSGKNRISYEILSRMEDESGNMLPPPVFITAAEKLGMATKLDEYVIENTLAQLRKNPDHVSNLSRCSINLSGDSASSERMLSFIIEQIESTGIDPRKLCFELTETQQIHDSEAAMELVVQLREMGCKIAFDDFGIGYSNYQSFSRLPVDIVKIDGSYINKLLENPQARADVEGMIHSAKSRALEIVAEYVENEAIVVALKNLGVDYAQGYYYAKPVPLEDLMGGTITEG
ncbi:PAS domain S-box-containing protein/diguanylate cyclase (GGDEF) domain-containing protein [Desulfuromusa kysingii]|uniref:PAS domain S-box-containing protein/diguanylate cyclase (GGDEF) domain-containing protein n=1 Tax=Desulfuromusa kysingii TaxID=37625 RepID=A0A1H3VZ13_9BACT|nr:EAL domain-containing protein [Desulfuromusa kysingii]SDZ80057.1 PAS domain S-box-containing protein/diguanylate cyclase (GGDEF) domain-containing protein [Desulfuromusa kysingii]